MKTLADRSVLEATVVRLSTIENDRLPSWGVMSASQMLIHLDGAFRMAARELPVASSLMPFPPIARFLVFRGGIRWRRNFQTVPELDLRRASISSEQVAVVRARLVGRMRVFVELPPKALLPAHPMLGAMSRWEWMRWGYMHTDHHLRQFGC